MTAEKAFARPGLIEMLRRPKTPLEQLGRDFSARMKKTGDLASAMEAALESALMNGGYSLQLRAQMLAVEPGEYADRMFAAAVSLFLAKSGMVGQGAGRMAEDLLPKVSDDTVCNQLDDSNIKTMLRNRDPARLKGMAELLGSMCRHVASGAESLVTRVAATVAMVGCEGSEQKEAALAFMRRLNPEVIEAQQVA